MQTWMYPGLERVGGSGKTVTATADTEFVLGRHFYYQSKDPAHEVVGWYLKRQGVQQAADLARKLEQLPDAEVPLRGGSLTHVHVRGGRKYASHVVYQFEPHRAHVTIVAPDPEHDRTVVVSIAGDAEKTTVQFVQSFETQP